MIKRHLLFIVISLALMMPSASAQKEFKGSVDWVFSDDEIPAFAEGIPSDYFQGLAEVRRNFDMQDENTDLIATLQVINEKGCSGEVIEQLKKYDLDSKYHFDYGVMFQRKKPVGYFAFLPFRKSDDGETFFSLTDYKVNVIETQGVESGSAKNSYLSSSQLANGAWYKIGVDTTGVFKMTFSDLRNLGLTGNIDAHKIRVHGYGSGMLPEPVDTQRPDDLPEIPVKVFDGGDGTIDNDDYILFYAESPDEWRYGEGTGQYYHTVHTYADTNYYFITTGSEAGKRIETVQPPAGNATRTIESYDYLIHHENDLHSIINSGRRFVGEKFDLKTEHSFEYDIPDLIAGSEGFMYSRVVARSTQTSTFSVNIASHFETVTVPSVSTATNSKYAQEQYKDFTFELNGPSFSVNYAYNQVNSSSIGWLDYFTLNLERRLKLLNGQAVFRSKQSLADNIVEYRIQQQGNLSVWDVSDISNIRQYAIATDNGFKTFKAEGQELKTFAAFDGSFFLEPILVGRVNNQDLHGLASDINYVIIAPEMFLDEAERLADFHRENSSLKVKVVNQEEIYNEFSSGMQDISAIRDFLKMLYDRSEPDNGLQYVLFFGDGSFDYKDIIDENTNIIPTYETPNSLHPVTSYATDDFFGYLDDGEGNFVNDMVDIGLGRLPVSTSEQATDAVEKIIHYGSNSDAVLGPWRNIITFIGDDEEGNAHLNDALNLSEYVNRNHPEYNLVKIMFDAYQQESTPGGQRYPAVNESINTRVQEGALIVNYTGHGGEVGWALERVLGIADIENWSNYDRLPVFVTATCEFSRFDDPERVSAGERVFTHTNGGGIALFTTTRATYGNPNYNLNRSFYNYALSQVDGETPRMGDLIRLAKRDNGGGDNGRKFILLGDPALTMAYPEKNARITHINGEQIADHSDTLKALSEVTMKGIVTDAAGNTLQGFNGIAYPAIYDKKEVVTTLGNDQSSYPTDFEVLNSILYKGKADVVDGAFEFSFVVPKDIDYQFGPGKVSLYAAGDGVDAHGLNDQVMVGGFDEAVALDENGPEIELFINAPDFREGGLTGPNPVLFARITDESGVNTVGNGIGHDLVAYIDNTEDVKVLNDYYEADLNTYKSGTVQFPFFNVEEGDHTLYIKAWDVYNNSATAELDFKVVSKDKLEIQRTGNHPNPVVEETYFTFEHNQKNTELTVELELFDVYGKRVHYEKHQQYSGNANKIDPIYWDGSTSTGTFLKKGVYIYKIKVSTPEGLVAEDTRKLLLIR